MWTLLKEDWKTYQRPLLAQGFWALQIHRFGTARLRFRSKLIRVPWGIVLQLLIKMSEILFGIYLGKDARIGRRFRIEHFGTIIVHNRTIIGDDVTIRQGVTIGMRSVERALEAPIIGSRVEIGAGAKILGNIRIGDDSAIGANAVVLQDVPPNSLAVGVPAVIKPRRSAGTPAEAAALG